MAAGLVAAPGGPAAQATTACTGASHWFDGTNTNPQTSYYAQANITTNPVHLCGSSHSVSSVWVMLHDNESSGAGGYAQSGYIRWNGQISRHMFAEYTKSASTAFTYKATSAAPPSGAPLYDEGYQFDTGHIVMQADNTTILTTPFDPAIAWHDPWDPEWEGEVHDHGDDMIGTSSAPTYFSNMLIRTCRSCNATHPNMTISSDDTSRWGVAWDSVNSKFHIWTK